MWENAKIKSIAKPEPEKISFYYRSWVLEREIKEPGKLAPGSVERAGP